MIANNLLDAAVHARDGASATVVGNFAQASSALFASAAAGDLHLLSSASVAIDKVAVRADAAVDWDGQLRPIGSSADIGADEYGTPTLPSTPLNVRVVR